MSPYGSFFIALICLILFPLAFWAKAFLAGLCFFIGFVVAAVEFYRFATEKEKK